MANRFRLAEGDSGCPGSPVVYRAAPGDAKPVVIHAGVAVPASAFKKDSNTAKGLTIWKADLGKLGLADLAGTSGNFHTGWNCANGNRTELFFGGNAMTVARHPNKANGSNRTSPSSAEGWCRKREQGPRRHAPFERIL